MGVDEFRRELATIKSSFELELIPDKEIYEKMCLDAQRRNLPNMASVSTDIQPLNSVGLKRLLWPVFVTLTVFGSMILIAITLLYRSLADEIRTSKTDRVNPFQKFQETNYNASVQFLGSVSHGAAQLLNTTSNLVTSSIKNIPQITNGTWTENNPKNNPRNNPQNSSDENVPEESVNSSTISNYKSRLKPLYYLSTGDGVLSHFFQLQHLWSITHSLKRPLVPVSFHCPTHYQDVEWINLCDIFELPDDIDCTGSHNQTIDTIHLASFQKQKSSSSISSHLVPAHIVKTHNCTILGIHTWALDPQIYSLPITQLPERNFDFLEGDCVAGYVDDKSGYAHKNKKTTEIVSFPFIKFKEKYMKIINDAKRSLGLGEKDKYTFVYWADDSTVKRGKEKEKEKEKEIVDKKIFANHHDFIKNVRSASNKNTGKLVYVKTGEKNETILSDLKKEGFKLYSDLNISTLNTLDSNILELGLMVDSSNQIFWGHSIFRSFSELSNSLKKITKS